MPELSDKEAAGLWRQLAQLVEEGRDLRFEHQLEAVPNPHSASGRPRMVPTGVVKVMLRGLEVERHLFPEGRAGWWAAHSTNNLAAGVTAVMAQRERARSQYKRNAPPPTTEEDVGDPPSDADLAQLEAATTRVMARIQQSRPAAAQRGIELIPLDPDLSAWDAFQVCILNYPHYGENCPICGHALTEHNSNPNDPSSYGVCLNAECAAQIRCPRRTQPSIACRCGHPQRLGIHDRDNCVLRRVGAGFRACSCGMPETLGRHSLGGCRRP